MLKRLEISNFALIDDLEIDFFSGLNILTGETGSGKTIILQSLNLLFGSRADTTFIRDLSKSARVLGIFEVDDNHKQLFNNQKEVSILRTIDEKRGNIIKINGEPISLVKLKDIMKNLGVFFSQNSAYNPLDSDVLLNYIDKMNSDSNNLLLNKYLLSLSNYNLKVNSLKDLEKRKKEALLNKDFIEYQINELKTLDLKDGEEEEIKERLNLGKNAENIFMGLENVDVTLKDNDISGTIYQIKVTLDKLAKVSAKYNEVRDRFDNLYSELIDLEYVISDLKKAIDFSFDDFEELNQRLNDISIIKRKYKMTESELVAYYNKIVDEYSLVQDYDNYIIEINKEIIKLKKDTLSIGRELSNNRKQDALKLSKLLTDESSELGLSEIKIELSFHENTDFLDNGIDIVEFLISFNKGEPLKPFDKVASGGEKSRIYMIIEYILASINKQEILIFDEVDTGISGKTVYLLANKLLQLSKNIQIFVITHQAIVASIGTNHFKIEKQLVGTHYQTLITKLDYNERVKELATMISGQKITSTSINQAKELLGDIK